MYLAQLLIPMARSKRAALSLCTALLLAGCASGPSLARVSRPFQFGQDTFAYSNALVWSYEFNTAGGRTSHHRVEPKPAYTHHCFVVARAARQFFDNAR